MTPLMDRRRFLINSLTASAAAVFGANPGWGARVDPAPGSIKITRVKLHVVNVPERKWWWSDDFYGQPEHQRVDNHVAEIETDQGLTGLTNIYRTSEARIVADLPTWVGRDVLKVNLQSPGVGLVGAFEQAVLDLRGQALGIPIWQLLGGRLRDKVLVAQTTGYKTPQHTAEQAQWGWEHGFRLYKMKCITPREDSDEKRIRYVTDRVEAIHKLQPGMAVRPDIRWRLREVWAPKRSLGGYAATRWTASKALSPSAHSAAPTPNGVDSGRPSTSPSPITSAWTRSSSPSKRALSTTPSWELAATSRPYACHTSHMVSV